MASSSGFEHNIFISYSHLDEVWKDRVVKHLGVAQQQGLLKTWDDRKLAGGDDWFSEITNAIDRGSIAVLLISANSLTSNFILNQEVPRMLARLKTQAARFFPIVVEYCDWEAVEWLKQFNLRPRDGRPVGINKDRIRTEEQINFDLAEISKEIRNLPPPLPVTPAKPDAPESFAVFLADASDELHKVRKRLARELQDKGVTIAPAVPPPMEQSPHDETARTTMEAAQLCVHLFDHSPGREIEDQDDVFYPQRQAELGMTLQRPQLIWTSPALDWQNISDAPHRAFLAGVRDGTRERTNYSFVTSPAADLASIILEQLETLKRAANAAQSNSSALLLDTHLKDGEYALALSRLLNEGRVASVINHWADGPSASAETWAMLLRHMRRMLIVCGKVETSWVFGRVLEASELANAEKLPLKVGVYYAASQHKGSAVQKKYGELTLYHFDEADIRNPQALQPLLADF